MPFGARTGSDPLASRARANLFTEKNRRLKQWIVVHSFAARVWRGYWRRAPLLAAAAVLMRRQRPGLRFILPVAPGLRGLVEPIVAQHGDDASINLLDGQSHAALAACDVTLVASGTAALEAALFKRPMVITYHLAALNWWRMRRMAYQPWFGLPNILSGQFVVPELIQDAATPEALAREGLAWLDDAPRCAAVQARFTDLHHQLRQNTASKASDAIAQVIGA